MLTLPTLRAKQIGESQSTSDKLPERKATAFCLEGTRAPLDDHRPAFRDNPATGYQNEIGCVAPQQSTASPIVSG
jgi:hypothetical protein